MQVLRLNQWGLNYINVHKKFLYSSIHTFAAHVWGDLVIPPGLKLGAGTSASQVEGAWNVDGKLLQLDKYRDTFVYDLCGKTPSVIDTLNHGNVSNGDDACKSYELWKTDVELIENLGLQTYRFSIPWARILPTGKPDYINQVAVDHYNYFIDALLEKNVDPVVTIMHFDLPQSLQDLGGWHNSEFPEWLADYARVLFSLYGDRVKTWLTINESIFECYTYDPQLFGNETQPNLCAKNLLLGHAKAWRVYENEFRDKQKGQATIVTNVVWLEAETDVDEPLAELLRQYYVGLYNNPIFHKEGGWPKDLQKALEDTEEALPELTNEEIKLIKGTYDFYAFNYYTSLVIRKARANETIGPWPLEGCPELGAVMEVSPKFKNTTFSGAYPIYPEGIRYHMNWINKQYNVTRFSVTENGLANNGTLDDEDKMIYIQEHLQQIKLAIEQDGLDVFNYAVWALLDTFEFESGYVEKFGLCSVNFTDPNRTRAPRDSFYYYKNLIDNAKNGRPTALVNEDGSNTKK